jgi:hypothetical protein
MTHVNIVLFLMAELKLRFAVKLIMDSLSKGQAKILLRSEIASQPLQELFEKGHVTRIYSYT